MKNDVKVVIHRDEQMISAERGMNCLGRALMRRRSNQELQGMRMMEDISTANNSRIWLHDAADMTTVHIG